MISAASIADSECVHAEIVERDHPRGKDGGDHFVALQIDAANPASAVVDVVVSVELGMLRRGLHHFGIGEMLLDVSAGAEQALLFPGPEANADGATHLEASGLEDADGFEHDRGAGTVIGGAGSRVPRIEVSAKHDDLVGLGFVRAGDFADDVEGIQVVVVELVLDIELQGDVDFFLEHSVDATVVFAGDGDTRRSTGIFFFVAPTSLHHENCSVIAAGRLDPRGNSFFDEKLLYFEIYLRCARNWAARSS